MKKMSITGRLTQDPQIRTIGSNPATIFTVATPTRRKDENGQTISNFVNCTVFSAVRDACAQNLHKGSSVFVMGDHFIRTYKDNVGADRYSEELTVSDIQFLDPRTPVSNGAPAGAPVKTAVPYRSAPVDDVEGNCDDDDLPF